MDHIITIISKKLEICQPKDIQIFRRKLYFYNKNILYCWSEDLSSMKKEHKVPDQTNITCIFLKNKIIICGTEDGYCYIWNFNSDICRKVNKCYDIAIHTLYVYDDFIFTCSSQVMTKWSLIESGENNFDFKFENEVVYNEESMIQSFYSVDSSTIYGVINKESMVLIWNYHTNELIKNKPLGKESSTEKSIKKLNTGSKYINIIVLNDMTVLGVLY